MLIHDVGLVAAVLLILCGWALARPRRRVLSEQVARKFDLAPASAHELGLAHRLAARLLVSSAPPTDESFVLAAGLWPSLVYVPGAARGWELLQPLTGLEDLLERLERFTARITRLGRRRGQS